MMELGPFRAIHLLFIICRFRSENISHAFQLGSNPCLSVSLNVSKYTAWESFLSFGVTKQNEVPAGVAVFVYKNTFVFAQIPALI